MKKRQKILHIITGLGQGGAEGVLARLCYNSKDKFEHVVLSLSDEGQYGAFLRDKEIKVYCIGLKGRAPLVIKIIFGFLKIVPLIMIVRRERPEIVQTWMYHANMLGGIAAWMAGSKHIFWNLRMSMPKPKEISFLNRIIVKSCIPLSKWLPEKIICPSEEVKLTHVSNGYPIDKISIIYNGIDLSKFHPDLQQRNRIRCELGIHEQDFLIGMVARLDPLKDHKNLLEALVLAKKEISFICVLIGSGMLDNKDFINEVYNLGLTKNIKILGSRNDIPAIMNALDLHVLSSSSEGSPNVLAEAMACGTPSISTDTGSASSIIGDISMCCPIKRPLLLSNLIIKQYHEWTDSMHWNRKKSEALKRIEQYFSLQQMVQKYSLCWCPNNDGH